MNNCIFHGNYTESKCPKCNQQYSDSSRNDNPNFILFIVKNSLLMAVVFAIGWLIFTY